MSKARLAIGQGIFILAILLIALRLFYWQVIKGDSLEIIGQNQYSQKSITTPSRGKIISVDGYPLASNSQFYELSVEIKDLNKQFDTLSNKISPIIYKDQNLGITASASASMTEEEKIMLSKKILTDKMQSSNSKWVILTDRVNEDSKKALQDLNTQGLYFTPKEQRYYPEGSMSAQLLGFVGKDKFGEPKGYFGLEGMYDRQLKGKTGFASEETDAKGRPILFGSKKIITKENGRDLILNLDRTVQFIVEEKLKKGIEKYGAKQGSVVVMEPKTGAILAIASFPQYDPDKYYSYDETLFRNPVVADSYEPGSTFKILVMAAGVNEGVVKPDTKCDKCSGPREIAGYSIRTWNNQYYPGTTMTEVIQHSDNTGMIFVEEKLGKDKFLKYIKDYGFGKSTGIDLEEESSPLLRNAWAELDLATSSFGQGIAVTPIQMARAASAIANGGKLMEPHVVKQMREESGKVIEVPPKMIKEVIKPSTAKVITEMMVNAVDNGESRIYKPQGYRIAGKTGTAQIPVKGHYDESKTVASFVGFAPADDPKFLILVILREPSSSQWGSETAAPLFFSIAGELFNYYKIAPSE